MISLCDIFCQVSLATVEHALIFLGHTTVSVISGLQAKTVRLTLMNVAVGTVAMRTTSGVVALTLMHPTKLVQNVKDLNVSAGMASQVFKINLAINSISFLKTHQQFTENISRPRLVVFLLLIFSDIMSDTM